MSRQSVHIYECRNFDVSVVFDPASIVKRPEWRPVIETIGAAPIFDSLNMKLGYGRRRCHEDCADLIGGMLSHAERVRYPHAGKNTLSTAWDPGKIKALWKDWTRC